MKVSIIIPTFNEESTILKVVRKIYTLPFPKEIIVVNDGSSDKTAEKLESLADKGIVVCTHLQNLGKGAAISTGLKVASGQIIVMQDADLEYYPEEIHKLLMPIMENKADVVYGSRFINTHHQIGVYYLGNRCLTYLTRLLFFCKITDMETGYKIFKTSVLRNLKIRSCRFNIEPEITAKIFKRRIRFQEIPISYKSRSHREGKKLTWKDGVDAAFTLLKYRFFD